MKKVTNDDIGGGVSKIWHFCWDVIFEWPLKVFYNPTKLTISIISIADFKMTLPPSKKVGFICFNRRPLKMMKNAFYFMSKALFLLRYLNFCTKFFGHVGKMTR